MLTVHAQTGIRNELAIYTPATGNLACAICGSRATASAPDGLLRERKGWVWNFALALARKRWHNARRSNQQSAKEVKCMNQPQEYAIKLAKLPDRVAAILGKTAAVLFNEWDEEKDIADDTALEMIRDLLTELDPSVIERNKNKRLVRR